MDFIDQLKAFAARIPSQLSILKTEEATKTALVMPFINILGYNVFDPTEVVPEFTADVGTKKGEKVDYAILREGKPIILFECKTATANLDTAHASQLYRYFSVTEARFGILTNGYIYRFFTDLEEPNKMDTKPFLEVNLLELDEHPVEELKRFSKSSFDIDSTVSAATELKYTKEIQRAFSNELANPSDDFVRHFASQVYSGKLVANVREQFRDITKRALRQFITEQINSRLKSALASDDSEPGLAVVGADSGIGADSETNEAEEQIVTTPDELEAYHIVKAILRERVNPTRLAMRDSKTYCAVLLDDNNRKPICRFWFNGSKKHLGLFDENKKETRVFIEKLDDIYQHEEQLRTKISHYAAELETETDTEKA
jgi:predicted type IV restriction endonuclease